MNDKKRPGRNPDNAPLSPSTGNLPVFINPGTGAVDNASEEYAIANMQQLLTDCAIDGLTFERGSSDYGGGRFAFRVYRTGFDAPCEVQMPGWTLEGVRFTGAENQNIWDFPRLYIDGSSWVWKWAVSNLKHFWDKDV